MRIRPVTPADHAQWLPLWEGYNAFYGRSGDTALPAPVTAALWDRFFDAREPVHALVAEAGPGGAGGEGLVGLAHYLYHRSTTRLDAICYLQDLFVAPGVRGQRIGQRLIEAVYGAARAAGSTRVYWQTQAGNAAGRALYDRVARHLGFIVYSHEL